MTVQRIPLAEFVDRVADVPVHRPWAAPGESAVVLVDDDGSTPVGVPDTVAAVVIALGSDPAPQWSDLALPATSPLLDAVIGTVGRNPLASIALVQVLRGSEYRSMHEGLLLESAVYSTLLAGPEFGRWRAAHPSRQRQLDTDTPVRVERCGNALHLTLQHTEVRNALDAAMRDALLEALDLAAVHDGPVVLAGDGPVFCAGGHLDEFGSHPDPALAHLVRTEYAIGPRLARLGERLTVRVHGPCAGSGVELPAFAARVEVAADTTFVLPEVSMGLIPGAGGTWSIPQRVGRHRTALAALSCAPISDLLGHR